MTQLRDHTSLSRPKGVHRSLRAVLLTSLLALAMAVPAAAVESPDAAPEGERPAGEDTAGLRAAVAESLTDDAPTAETTSGPWAETARLLASDGAANDVYGISVALDGDTALVGATLSNVDGNANQGAGYVYARVDGTWTEQARLVAEDGQAGDNMGFFVALDGDTAVLGAPRAGGDSGAAWVFTRDGEDWSQQARLTPASGGAGSQFGISVAVDGDTIAVGGWWANVQQGAAWVFTRDGDDWTEHAHLSAEDGAANDNFGYSMSLEDDLLAVGATGVSSGAGRAYVFARTGEDWSEVAELAADDADDGANLGMSVSLDDGRVLAGAPSATVDGAAFAGAAYLFAEEAGTWSQAAKLVDADGVAFDQFGWSVSLQGTDAIGSAVAYNSLQGVVHTFEGSGDTWTQTGTLASSSGESWDEFGFSVAVDGDTILAGASREPAEGNFDRGAAYVFEREQTERYADVQLQARTNLIVNDDGYNLPPGSSFNSISPDINDDGQVAFRVQIVTDPGGGDSRPGVWLGSDGSGEIVHTGQAGGGIPADTTLNIHGDIAYALSDGGFDNTLYRYDAAAETGAPVNTSPVLPNSYGSPSIDDDGTITFQANFSGGRAYAGVIDGEGVFYTTDNSLDPDSPYTFLYTPAGNNIGQIAAKVATSTDMTSDIEIRLFDADGSSELILANVGTDPESPYQNFDNSIAVNTGGTVAAATSLVGGGRAVIRSDGSDVDTIAVAGEGPIESIEFFPPSINDDGLVAFRAVDQIGQAIYVGDGTNLTRVIGADDIVETDLGTGQLGQHDSSPIFGGAPAINSHGDVVFTAGLHPEGDDQVEWGSGVFIAYAERPAEPEVVEVVVEPAEASVEVGEDVQFTATAIYDDDSQTDVTDDATWTSDDTDVATVTDTGQASGVSQGTVEIAATYADQSGAATLTVTEVTDPDPIPDPELVEVVVTPAEASVAVEGDLQLTATAVYDDDETEDVTAEATWSSSDEAVAIVTDTGLASGVSEGTTEITATYDGESDSATLTVTDEDDEVPPPLDGVFRIFGQNRFETAVEISQDSFGDGEAGSVVLARGDEFADALAGTPLAVDRDAPILLTPTDVLIDIVADEIDRVLPAGGTVYLLGGTVALDATVEADLSAAGYNPVRLSGPERIATSLAIADELGNPDEILITTGFNFPDALAAGAAAVEVSGAVILTTSETPDPAVDSYLAAHTTTGLYGIGGPAARAYPDATPVFGATREETAAAVADAFFTGHTAVAIARQDDFPDALAGGAHIGHLGGPLLLTPTDNLHPATSAHICANADTLTAAYIYGGTLAIDTSVETTITDRLNGTGCE